MATLMENTFDIEKERVLKEKSDISRKGNIDEPIIDLVKYINWQTNYYTTSSCSGRIAIFINEVQNNYNINYHIGKV